ncbi:chymotrypsin BI-like [Penaeus monodon]|uniref:chymotrypsin BI-like n=1 Tax=Penaeus monodon TaxID=6687 RepID=UPI0018A6EDC9|nr:chymotrypsin BI-like [Penaeus monodon]
MCLCVFKMVPFLAALCVYAVAGEPAFKFNWIPLLEVVPEGPPRAHVRIVGGAVAEPHKYGYQAVLIENGSFICGAVVISDQFLLTAAHCITDVNKRYKALMGGHNLSEMEKSQQIIGVEKVFLNSNYTTIRALSDIAVLKLKEKMKINKEVYPIKLPTHNVHPGMPLVVTGWGITKSAVEPFTLLQKISTSTIDQSTCRQHVLMGGQQHVLCVHAEPPSIPM